MSNLKELLQNGQLSDYAKQVLVSLAAVYPATIDCPHFDEMYFTHRQGLDELLEKSLLSVKSEKLALSDNVYKQVVQSMDMSYQAVDIAFNGRMADAFYVDPQEDNSHLDTLVPAAQALLKRYELADINVFTLANNLANYCYNTGAYEQALAARLQCHKLLEQFDDFGFMGKVSDLYNLYQILLAMDQKEEARSALVNAIALLEKENMLESNEYHTLNGYLLALDKKD